MKTNFKIFVFALVFVLLFGLLSVSVSAAVDPDYNIFIGNPSDSTSVIGSYTNGNYVTVSVDSQLFTSPCVGCFYGSSPSNYNFLFVSTVNTYQGGYFSVMDSSGTWLSYLSSPSNSSQSAVVDHVTYYYTIRSSSNLNLSGVTLSWPVVSSMSSALEACISALNYTPPVTPSDFSFDLPAGNAAYIELGSSGISYDLSATMPEPSVLWIAGAQPRFWPADSASWFRVSALPSPGDTFDNSDETLVDWQRGTDVNMLSQTRSAVYSDTVSYASRNYLVIYNPPYYTISGNGGVNDSYMTSPTIHVSVEDALSVTAFSVTGGTVSNPVLSLGGIQYDLNTDGTWTDSDGGSSAPPVGGGNYIPADGDIVSVLSKLVSDIDSFFKGTWNYIQSLVNTLGDFPGYIVELFSWLPDEFRSIILAAFSIVIVIGVLKVML